MICNRNILSNFASKYVYLEDSSKPRGIWIEMDIIRLWQMLKTLI
jgi:hypothetical protein